MMNVFLMVIPDIVMKLNIFEIIKIIDEMWDLPYTQVWPGVESVDLYYILLRHICYSYFIGLRYIKYE